MNEHTTVGAPQTTDRSRTPRVARAAALCFGALALAGCALSTEDVDYAEGYVAALERAGDHAGSLQDVERFQRFMSSLSAETVQSEIDQVYAQEAYLNDHLVELTGRDAIEAYLLRSLEQMALLSISYDDAVQSGPDWYLRWTLEMRFEALRDGALVTTTGMSHVRFDSSGQVVVHRDFWDTASGLYEHVPGVGNAIGDIKKRF